uniref:Condensin complex subunit 1 C-terminal domain-containing protein n=1 Tax=Hyaloperonospora arabidopsidis (strain Emoy2) TaxID=559515 RepID=M4BY65_HYAAE
MVLHLAKSCFQYCEQSSREKDVTFLRNADLVDRLTKCLSHMNSNVRKCAVDCLVALHFAVMEDNRVVPAYLATNVDEMQHRLVEIFIDRAKLTRHPSC